MENIEKLLTDIRDGISYQNKLLEGLYMMVDEARKEQETRVKDFDPMKLLAPLLNINPEVKRLFEAQFGGGK
jgi:hypothetical protein